MLKLGLIFVLLFTPIVHSSLSPTFFTWINKTYGEAMARVLNRDDLGPIGSYGGGKHKGCTKTHNQPIIIVHGVISTADSFGKVADYFLDHGYGPEEVYATTWGNGARDNIATVYLDCNYVKQVRYFIEAVNRFTKSNVDVLAFSMGSPLARKAILGGYCVENCEYLGPPLTRNIDTFISVAGTNQGFSLCDMWGSSGTCSIINGVGCNSLYLKDINSEKMSHYEGTYIYSIYSKDDDIVGDFGCGKNFSSIQNADKTFTFDGLNHEEVMYGTLPMQYSLVTRHKAEQVNITSPF